MPRAASSRPNTCRASCCSAMDIPPRATSVPASRTSRRTGSPCRSNRWRRARSPTLGRRGRSADPHRHRRLAAGDGHRRQPTRRHRRDHVEGDRSRASRQAGSRTAPRLRQPRARRAVTFQRVDAGRARSHRRRAGRLRRRGAAHRPRRSARGQQRAGQRGVGRSAAQGALRRRRARRAPAISPARSTAPASTSTIRPASAFPTTRRRSRAVRRRRRSATSRERPSPTPSMAALTDWVEKGGGGLLVAGGESVFGESGYRKTPIERLTPVTFERKDEPEVALIIVLDRSWSMAGSSMELTKTAAQAAVDVLTDEQSVGILTFNDKFDWDVTAAQRRQESRRHPQEDRGDRPGRTHADFPGGRAGLLRAAQCQGPREARHPALGRPLVSRRLRGAGQEDDRGADHALDGGGRALRRSGAAQEPGDMGQRAAPTRSPMRRRSRRSSSRKPRMRPRQGSTRRPSRRS